MTVDSPVLFLVNIFNIRFFLFIVLLSQNRTKRAAASKQPYSLYRFIFIDDKALSASYKSKPCSTAEKPPTGRFFWQVRNAYPSRGIFSCKIPLCFNPNFGLKHSPPNAPDDKGVSHSAECDQSFTLDWTTFEKVDKTFCSPSAEGGRKL